MNDIRYPNITGATEAAQLQQVRSYLHQLVDQLNMTLQDMVVGSNANAPVPTVTELRASEDKQAQSTFDSIKSLIIKSADIVNAYYDEINYKLEGMYVAESEFGVFAEQTSRDIKVTSDRTEELFTNLQQVISQIDGIANQTISVNAYLNSGLLDYDDEGIPVYGLEIGQHNEVNGEEVFNKYARFTADRLSFFDKNDNEVAYISDNTLHINRAEVAVFAQGGFEDTTQSDGSIVTKWLGV